MSETADGVRRDIGIISAAQKIEQYDIASYGTLIAFAEKLDLAKIKDLLEATLEEEKKADSTLTDICQSSINEDVMADVGVNGRM